MRPNDDGNVLFELQTNGFKGASPTHFKQPNEYLNETVNYWRKKVPQKYNQFLDYAVISFRDMKGKLIEWNGIETTGQQFKSFQVLWTGIFSVLTSFSPRHEIPRSLERLLQRQLFERVTEWPLLDEKDEQKSLDCFQHAPCFSHIHQNPSSSSISWRILICLFWFWR